MRHRPRRGLIDYSVRLVSPSGARLTCVSTGRRRAEAVAANDAAIRGSAASIILRSGWDALTFTGVAKGAGLTVGAVYARAESSVELGIDLWEQSLSSWLNAAVADLVQSAIADDGAGVLTQLQRWEQDPSAALSVEMLIAALFDDDLAEVIAPDARRILEGDGDDRRGDELRAAARVLLTSFAFGRAIAQRAHAKLPRIGAREGRTLAAHFHPTAELVELPALTPLQWVRPMEDVDPHHADVLRASIGVVGRVGYRRATIARIARAAGVPRGTVMRGLNTKAALVAEAARLALVPPGEVWSQYADVVASQGPLIARAMFLADFLRPVNRTLWALNLELGRMSRSIPELQGFCPGGSVLEQTHLGVMLTASYRPGIEMLPYAGPFSVGSTT